MTRLGVALALGLGAGLATPVEAQRVWELGPQAIATASDPTLGVIAAQGSLRPADRLRVALTAGIGTQSGEVAGRFELLGEFLLSPHVADGVGVYGGGGIAADAGPAPRGYMVVLLGLEGNPGGPSGWLIEAGFGGGVRVAVGYRWRKLPPGWKARK